MASLPESWHAIAEATRVPPPLSAATSCPMSKSLSPWEPFCAAASCRRAAAWPHAAPPAPERHPATELFAQSAQSAPPQRSSCGCHWKSRQYALTCLSRETAVPSARNRRANTPQPSPSCPQLLQATAKPAPGMPASPAASGYTFTSARLRGGLDAPLATTGGPAELEFTTPNQTSSPSTQAATAAPPPNTATSPSPLSPGRCQKPCDLFTTTLSPALEQSLRNCWT
mmetsp:Transcript_49179/g.130596  ORF Transcript_49179/g.130596 Transcript_49179/m.130596 type:complete len:227 (-) Transcript_49179:317-997(-)